MVWSKLRPIALPPGASRPQSPLGLYVMLGLKQELDRGLRGLREEPRFYRNEMCEKLGLVYGVASASLSAKAITSYDF